MWPSAHFLKSFTREGYRPNGTYSYQYLCGCTDCIRILDVSKEDTLFQSVTPLLSHSLHEHLACQELVNEKRAAAFQATTLPTSVTRFDGW